MFHKISTHVALIVKSFTHFSGKRSSPLIIKRSLSALTFAHHLIARRARTYRQILVTYNKACNKALVVFAMYNVNCDNI